MDTQRGLAVTTQSHEVIDCINSFHQNIVGSGLDAGLITDAAKKHPENVLIQIYAAVYYLYAQEDVANTIAKTYLQAAERYVPGANIREQLLYNATLNWSDLKHHEALSILEQVMQLYPRDTLAMKLMEWLFYCTGQAYQAEYFLRVCTMCAAENQDESHFLATHSFALELCGHYARAREMAEAAINMELITPWAHHTLAHVALLTQDLDGGIKRLNSLKDSWQTVHPLSKGHNTWHLALLYLAQRNENDVLKLYPSISGTLPDTVLEQIDAVSLLWRLDMAGLPQNEQLNSIAEHLGNHPIEHYIGFNNLHFIYCLVRAGQKKQAAESLKKMEHYASSTSDSLWAKVILPLCQGIYSFAEEDYNKADSLLTPVIDKAWQLGGSDAQVDLFAQTYLQTLLHTKQMNKAQHYFSHHLSHYKNTPLADFWFMS
ncbi:tetratricopeptide repeat protein [Legionella quateirensis]|uniref:Tetratricopeptide repeat protein 38 n=1 Tax=Legionella quateirensis TaxID=45072 RepID=A0A378KR02_9GAMM|nr:tetratricopeptide repeat protein [Legionella quateirensis]KTD44504.1 hypothetical protein Lqua_2908 [Legionella quateirensis]STY16992.1 Uncharacterised protein [Legionella quateirensis]